MSDTPRPTDDGQVPSTERQGDLLAIQGLALAYAHAVDDADWDRWEALFVPDAHIDYASSGGIVGTPADMAAWLPDALSIFTWTMHSIYSHEVRFTGDDRATGRVHLFNRNGVEWKGESEIFDVGGFYDDEYVRAGGAWRFSRRIERTVYLDGGAFAEMLREMIANKDR